MNRLAQTNSPYLLGHAGNPVDWWPWSDAAFEEARRRDVPVFLSIGYATCHWCHVMEHESFEDAEAARALNDAFVCVKVDREERPDVDGVYMAAVLAATGRGGWPLTALLTPDTREPFWVGTYLPRESRGGRIGVLDLAENVSRFWRENADGVRQSASELAGVVRRMGEGGSEGDALGAADVDAAAEALRRRFDPAHGGFGAAPKFPTPHHVLFALRRGAQTGDESLTALAVATLRAIRRGGVYDQLGGGLHRYATDRAWLLPHFEKMLYDQAGYALACTEAWAATGAPDLREAAEATLDYVLRDLRSPTGAFFSAEDADSLNAHGEREEGAFYVWTEAEIDAALDADDARIAKDIWGTEPAGNYADEATGQKTGANVLHHPAPDLSADDPLAPAAERLGLDTDDLRARLGPIRRALLDVRAGRPRPLLDDKVLTDWNGLAIAALVVAARTFGRDDYADAAGGAAAFLLGTMRTDAGGLLHRYRDGEAGIDGLLDDYAFLVWGLTELYQTTFDEAHLAAALDLHAQMRERFEDSEGGYFVSPADAPDLIVRQKSPDDGALPAGASVAVYNGLRLARLTGRPALEEAARRGLRAPAVVREHPSGFTHLLTAAAFAAGPAQEVVVAGERGGADTAAVLAAVRSVYAPFAVALLRAPGVGPAPISELAPFAEAQTALPAPRGRGGAATAYVCRDHVCSAPTMDPEAARARLAEAVAAPPAGG
ncbi:thioredoxin domain-containing protein [Rubrivirga sp. S365]|uniref:Thioredoxin domain-containing protein n=1 Tax=Rubrivirga litoralis TaxID=3075598 RepID=A0ABU3BMH1_9BACT|nr:MULTISPECIES: thioredoxin domain-containing protein [unclassified Rubrivirga]MDT0630460.1 thioredoxin domain-containing protein [Rubrivirga sp. F394]MDT7857562.1 thioredoxin domain-containing protein [Rubrivirga sp. S365]